MLIIMAIGAGFFVFRGFVLGNTAENLLPGQGVLPGVDMGYEAIILKPQVERFCQEFVLHGCCNAKRAYMIAYPKAKATSAEANASRLLSKDKVKQRIPQIQAEWRRRLEAKVLGYHENVMSVKRERLLDETGKCKPLSQWSEEELSVLEFEQVSSKDGVRTLLKIPTRHQSAVELARISGMHTDKVEMTGKDGAPLGDGLTDIERSARLVALLDTARARRDGQAAHEGDAAVGATAGAAE